MFLKVVFAIFFSLFFIGCSTNDKLPDKCFKKGKTGMCRGYFIKYNFNPKQNKCEKYVYGGCGKVVFNTLEECQQTCEK